MMEQEFKLNNKYVVSDTNSFLKSLWVYTKSSQANLDDIIGYINTHDDAELFITNQLEVKQMSSYNTEYAWVDTGYSTPEGDPLIISFVETDTYPLRNGFLGTVTTLAKKIAEYHYNYSTDIKRNQGPVKNEILKRRKNRNHEANTLKCDLLMLSNAKIIEKFNHFQEQNDENYVDSEMIVPETGQGKVVAVEYQKTNDESTNIKQIKKSEISPTVNDDAKENTESAHGEEYHIEKNDQNTDFCIGGLDMEKIAGNLSIDNLHDYLSDVWFLIQNDDGAQENAAYIRLDEKTIVNTGIVCMDGSYLCILYQKEKPTKVIENRMQVMDEGFSLECQLPGSLIKFPDLWKLNKPVIVQSSELQDAYERFISKNAETHQVEDAINRFGGHEAFFNAIKKETMLRVMMSKLDRNIIQPAYTKDGEIRVIKLPICDCENTVCLAIVLNDTEKEINIEFWEKIAPATRAYALYD